MPYKSYLKPVLDFVIAAISLVFLMPLLLCITLLLYWNNKGKPFFIQERPGKDEEIFKMFKFRSMTDDLDENGHLLPKSERLTKIGKFIRDYSLDEIPQLLNVLKGDMSLIGPRPLLIRYLPYYSVKHKTRHNIKPGITGWAQVNGRNTLSWEQKFNYDVWYVNNLTLWIDLKILFFTVAKVFTKEGVYNKEQGFVKDFVGD